MAGSASGYALRSAAHQPTSTHNPEENDSTELLGLDYSEKLRGYAASLALLAPHLSLLPVVESHDDPDQAYSLARKMLAQHTTMQGLYVSTANSLTVLRAIREAGRLNSVRTVVTDLSPELVSEMENGYVMQGKRI